MSGLSSVSINHYVNGDSEIELICRACFARVELQNGDVGEWRIFCPDIEGQTRLLLTHSNLENSDYVSIDYAIDDASKKNEIDINSIFKSTNVDVICSKKDGKIYCGYPCSTWSNTTCPSEIIISFFTNGMSVDRFMMFVNTNNCHLYRHSHSEYNNGGVTTFIKELSPEDCIDKGYLKGVHFVCSEDCYKQVEHCTDSHNIDINQLLGGIKQPNIERR